MNFSNKILPFPRSYWVIPGLLLAGHIPTNRDHSISIEKITNLVNIGIKTFINLQEENETNEEGLPFQNYVPIIEELNQQKNLNISFYRFPIKDLNIPSVSIMKKLLAKIKEEVSANRPVYVHCWGGIGRTGTVVGCYLLENGFATKKNVLEMIRYLRRTDPEIHRKSPETEQQEKFVLNWEGKNLLS